MWADEKKIRVHSLPDYKKYKRDRYDDRHLCKELFRYLDEADVVCAHNGDRFDLPLIMGRFWMNGIHKPSPFDTIDTLKAMRQFRLDSNKLDNVARQRRLGHKIPNTGAHLWRSCGEGDRKAWKKMAEYCGHDTELLATTYKDLAPWMKSHPALHDDGCHVCGSHNLHRRGPVRKSKTRFQFRCEDCHHWMVKTVKG
jgi:uncharacterized protein YprB with RNaseH-like and TPR domain